MYLENELGEKAVFLGIPEFFISDLAIFRHILMH